MKGYVTKENKNQQSKPAQPKQNMQKGSKNAIHKQ